MSRQNSRMWIVKDGEGRIFGPFTTEQVFEQIDRGFFLGTELIATYPGGRWGPLSVAPDFADRLLDVLAAEARAPVVGGSAAATKATRRSTAQSIDSKQTQTGQNTSERGLQVQEHTNPALQSETKTSAMTSAGGVIELTDLKTIEEKERRKNSKLPIILIGSAAALVIIALLFTGEESGGNRIRLLAPRAGQPEIANQRIVEKYKKAMSSLQSDTFSGYQRAQGELVEVVEGVSQAPEFASKKAAVLSTLCIVYRELWPYAHQDSIDLKTVSNVMQEAKRLDPAGLNGAICEIIHKMLRGQNHDAQNLTESTLLEQQSAPVLFEIRGDLYFYAHDAQNAVSYFSQARQLWPAWQKTKVQEARAWAEQKKFPDAMKLYREVLATVPKHAVAQIELGLIEYKHFSHDDLGLDLLAAALDSGERVPSFTEASAYLGLAEIHHRRGQKKKALEYARKAYALNSSSQAAKDLIVSLAGADGLQGTKVEGRELMFVGEQYLRAGDCFSAQAEFKAAFEAEPKNGVAAMKAGKCLWKLNQSGEAIEWLKKAIQADPNLTSAYVELADYYAQRYDFLSATRALQKIQALQPKNYEVYRGFATVELRRNNFNGAVTYAEKALKFYESDLETFLIMARAKMGLQLFPEAQHFASKALELDVNSSEGQSLYAKIEAGLYGVDAGAQYAQNLINRFVIVQGQQVPAPAIEYRVTLGEIYMQDERFRQAEEAFRQAVSLEPGSKKALIGLGKALQSQNQSPEALEVFLKAAVLDPSDADPIFYSGLVYSAVGKHRDAINQFERVVKNNPRYPRAHVALGREALLLQEPKRALDEAMQERSVNPELADAYVLAAEAYYELKQYGNCAAQYQKAVGKKAQGALLLVRMARCYRLTGAIESAQSLLRQAQALESGLPELYKEQGAIFHMRGLADEALTAYETYLKLVPGASDKQDVEMLMRRIQSGDMTVGGGG